MYVKIVKVERHNENVSTIYFNKKFRCYPGQFIMLNVPGFEEIPLSLSSPNSVTVKAVGETTAWLVNAKAGTEVGIRGPFGNPFSLSSSALLIAGGIGIAPIKFLHDFLLKCGSKVSVVFGEKKLQNLFWLDRFKEITVTTEDGSFGIKGTVLDALILEDFEKYEKIYVCGSEAMLKAVHALLKERGVLARSEFSLERFMRCGIGVCGSCVIENGMRVCTDGPVFKATELPW